MDDDSFEICGGVTAIASTALTPFARQWRQTTLELARNGAISARSIYPYGYSVAYLIRYLTSSREGLIPLDHLYRRFRLHAGGTSMNHTIGREQFEGHLHRWASVAGYSVDGPHTLVGARFRNAPLSPEAKAAFIEGFLINAPENS